MATVEALVALARHPKFVGIGETGLDYHYTADSAAVQPRACAVHIEAARRTAPAAHHPRPRRRRRHRPHPQPRSTPPAASPASCTASPRGGRWPRPRWPWASTSRSPASPPSATPRELRAIFADAPRDRLLVETDSPYLAPQPHRGKRNEPAYTADTARAMAGHLGLDPAEFAALTSANFDRLFTRAIPIRRIA